MPTYVTKPFLPPLEEFIPYLEEIWNKRVLSNGGSFHIQFEKELVDFLKINQISLFTNGTLALLIAIEALKLTNSEIITTPYSFVATSSSVVWSGNTPVFVDIDPDSLNINPLKIEKAITSKTKAILAVHCYGNPCDMEAIERIAQKYNLRVIYDAAPAFGVETSTGSILNHGDLSILSFHATKAFNTFEGGAIVSPDLETKTTIDRLKNFGFSGETSVTEIGINAKMSEFNAALGLLQLKHFEASRAKRGFIDELYRKELDGIRGIRCLEFTRATRRNFSYFPIRVQEGYGLGRDSLYELLKTKNIFSRRYFYPLISEFSIYSEFPSADARALPVATQTTKEILCLPIYPDLPTETVKEICRTIKAHQR